MIRKPSVAGQFYPAQALALEKEVSAYSDTAAKKVKTIGCVSPHAGYMYSGPVAGAVLSRLGQADTYIILGPNHSGRGKPFSVDVSEKWLTPLGEVEIDANIREDLIGNSRLLELDSGAHIYEHSIEVQVPFLQYLYKGAKIVPIVIGPGCPADYKEIGKAVASSIKKVDRRVVIIASSDMTHYESLETAKKKDRAAIERILALDIDGFLGTVARLDISMCGFAPTAIMMHAALMLGASKSELVKYQTSGDASGDYSAVVGYAGIIVS